MIDLYKEWNLLLLREYFTPSVAGEEVWIQTSREELDAFGFHLGGAGGLIDAIKKGPIWYRQNTNDMAALAINLAKQRRAPTIRPYGYQDPGETIDSYRALSAPIYLPFVAIWVLAAAESGANGFYATVSSLTGNAFNGSSARKAMEFLFLDLEYWSIRQTEQKFGVFHSRPLGGYPFVGLAKSQILAAGKDRIGINRLFKQVGLAIGQEIGSEIFNSLIDTATNAHFLSSGLREAFREVDIYGPVLKEILQFRLSEWDGRIPSENRRTTQEGDRRDANQLSQEVEDELSLVLRPAFNVDWNIGLRLQSTIEATSYAMEINNVRFVGYADETNSYVTFLDPENDNQIAVCSLLVEALDNDVTASLIYSRDGDENGEGKRSSYFLSKEVRVLVWDKSNPKYGPELVERELPVSGSAYLLIPNNANLEYLKNERIKYQQVEDASGLPNNWMLLSLPAIEEISPNQKRAIQSLTGQSGDVFTRARIKFIGGCPILRGGAKQYANYDLPVVELDAPIGAEIKAAGLKLREFSAQGTPNKLGDSNIRRFKIQKEDSDKHLFEFVVSHGQEILTKAKLKVAISTGAATGLDKAFSIDRFGESRREENGVRGLAIGNYPDRTFDISESEFFVSERFGVRTLGKEENFKENLACMLLDMVAQKGSIEFGPARKLIARMAESTKNAQVHPTFLLLELRSRGHIEIETDQKGHLLRVHKTPPTLFSLPIVTNTSSQWYGVCGSLRLEHWLQLCKQNDIEGYYEKCAIDRAPVLRLTVANLSVLQNFSLKTEFELAKLPAYSIANWVGTVDETREKLQLNRGYENFRVNNLERLNPQSVCFSHENAKFMKVDINRRCELFRIDDPVIQGSQIYMLGSATSSGVDFNYIQDSRWAIWLATTAFFKMISNMGFPDAYPWPLPYSQLDGSIWFPARLKPPLVIERALCLCSGSGPQQVTARKESSEMPECIQLVNTKNNSQVIGKLNSMYTEMANGTWLRYQWVPRCIAEQLAANLGCRLEEI